MLFFLLFDYCQRFSFTPPPFRYANNLAHIVLNVNAFRTINAKFYRSAVYFYFKMWYNHSKNKYGDVMLRLKELRKSKSLNQSQVANAIGISQRTYSNYEIGTREPDINTIIKLADYFNVTIDYLLCRDCTQSNTRNAIIDLSDLDKDDFEIVNEYIQFIKSRKSNKI